MRASALHASREHVSQEHYRDIATSLLERPDEVMLEVGAGGELLVARLRVAVAAMLLLLPLINAMTGGTISETMIGLAGAVFVNIFAQVWLALARQKRRFTWLPSFATCSISRARRPAGRLDQPPAQKSGSPTDSHQVLDAWS